MTRHVSTENLARFRADDLSPARSRRVAAHLRNCARCRETSDALARVPSLLAAVQVPPMPAHLAARIETALAAESAHRAAGAPSPAAPSPAGTPERPARRAGARRRHRRPAILSAPALRVLAVAGAAVVLVGGGVELLSHATGSSSTADGSGSGTTSGSAPAAGRHAAGQVARPRGTSGGNFNSMNGPIQYQRDGRTTVITPVRTGTNYRSARLTQQVSGVIAAHRAHASSAVPAATANSGTAATPPTPPRTLSGCVSRIAAGRTVLLVDVARFDHQAATIIVIARQGASAAQVWVVRPGCSATASDILAHRALSGH
jgi:hypothetical protein